MGVKVRERKPGEWWIFIDHKGKRKAKKVGSQEAADAAAVDIEKGLGTKEFNLRNKAETVTLRKFAESWMSGHVKKNLKPASVRAYRADLDGAILPEFGAYPVDQIPREEVKAFAYRLLERRHHKTEENPRGVPYSKKSVHKIIRTLSALMGHAVEDGLAARNTAAMPGKFIKLEKTDLELLTPEEGEVLFASIRKHSPADYPLIFTLYRSGMRKGEARGLQWGDIDWSGKFIEIRRAFSGDDLGTPKSGKTRRVELGDLLIKALERHLVAEKARALKEGRPLAAWVFPGEPGEKEEPDDAPPARGPLPDDAINTIHDRVLRKAKLRLTRVHDARHCFASWNLSAGASLFWVSRQMGHSSIKVTADLYGKYIPTEDRTAANLLDGMKTRNLSATSGQTASGGKV